jgi:hypothetical protein
VVVLSLDYKFMNTQYWGHVTRSKNAHRNTTSQELLERLHLGRYRAVLAEEMIDLDALGLFSEEDNEVLRQDLTVAENDLAKFREATVIASQMAAMKARGV